LSDLYFRGNEKRKNRSIFAANVNITAQIISNKRHLLPKPPLIDVLYSIN